MLGGKIVETGGVELAQELYTEGYDRIRAAYPEGAAAEEEMAEVQPVCCQPVESSGYSTTTELQSRGCRPWQLNNMATTRKSPLPENEALGEINKYDFVTPTTKCSRPSAASTPRSWLRSPR